MMQSKLLKLYINLYKKGYFVESFDLIEIIKSAGVDPVATSKTQQTELEEGYFNLEDNNPERYREKIWNLYYKDIKPAHFDRYVRKYIKEGYPEEAAKELAEKKIREIVTKTSNKTIESHKSFIEVLKGLEPDPNIPIVSPGSGFAHEQVVAPELKWRGLEYQKNLVDLAQQRNKQLGNPSTSEVWSLTKVDPGDELGEEWGEKINTMVSADGNIETVYAKHACGGLTDGVIYDAVKNKVKKLMLATCCANRYPEISWRVLGPKDESGSLISFEEYSRIAKNSKKPGDLGRENIDRIDSWREDYLKNNGYVVERGITKYGPYITAILKTEEPIRSSLASIANSLDSLGYYTEADLVDSIIKKFAASGNIDTKADPAEWQKAMIQQSPEPENSPLNDYSLAEDINLTSKEIYDAWNSFDIFHLGEKTPFSNEELIYFDLLRTKGLPPPVKWFEVPPKKGSVRYWVKITPTISSAILFHGDAYPGSEFYRVDVRGAYEELDMVINHSGGAYEIPGGENRTEDSSHATLFDAQQYTPTFN